MDYKVSFYSQRQWAHSLGVQNKGFINDCFLSIVQKSSRRNKKIKRAKTCHVYEIKRDIKKHLEPLLGWFGCGSSWISEHVLAGGCTSCSLWRGLPFFRCSAMRDDATRAITMVTSLFPLPSQSILLVPSVCCYADFSPPASQTFFFLVEEVWNPSRLKGEVKEGVESRLRRRRGVGEVSGAPDHSSGVSKKYTQHQKPHTLPHFQMIFCFIFKWAMILFLLLMNKKWILFLIWYQSNSSPKALWEVHMQQVSVPRCASVRGYK